ncbi:Ubiquitin conjugation factor E4 [Thecaphora frezii]
MLIMSGSALQQWQAQATAHIFAVALTKEDAQASAGQRIFLKDLAHELAQENNGALPPLDSSIADRILISRLSLDPSDAMTDDADQLAALASLPKGQTSWDYLAAAWNRAKAEEAKVKKALPNDAQAAYAVLEHVRSLLISYIGLVLQTPDMFPNSQKGIKTVSPLVLVPSLIRVAAPISSFGVTSDPSASTTELSRDWETIDPSFMPAFTAELAQRFGEGEGLDEILGPAYSELTRRIRDGDEETPLAADRPGPSSAVNGPALNTTEALNQAAAAGNVQAVLAHLLGQAGAAGLPGAAGGGRGAAGVPGLPGFGKQKEGLTIAGLEWRPYVNALVEATQDKRIAAMIATLPNFNPADTTGTRIELDSLLGPVLRLSIFPDGFPSLTEQYFGNPDNRSPSDIHSNFGSVRSTLEIVHSLNFRIFNAIVRSGPGSREEVLAYWGRACALNAKRGAMQVDSRLVATDGYMVNLFELLVRFAEPFMDAGLTKIDRIDLEYLRTQKRFDVSDLTRLNATEAEAREWADKAPAASAAPNFITEVFYLAVRLNNLGPGKAIRRLGDLEKEMQRLKKRVGETEADRPMWSSMPQAPQYEAFLKKAKAEVARMHAEIYAAQAQLLDPDFVQKVIVFNSFVMTWLVRLAEPKAAHPHPKVTLPLPQEVPERFRMLPEHVFEDVCDTMLFISRYVPDSLTEPAKNDLTTFCTTFLSSGWYIKNPFLRAKLAEILFYNVIPFGHHRNGIMGDHVNVHELALRHLVPALMSFWIEAESTGSHTQFYDKFNIRYHLSQIFKAIWSNPQHKEQLHREAKGRESDFVVFINRLMNDVTFLLDDALEKLQELHQKQSEMDDAAAWNARPVEERQERETHVRSIQGQVKSDLQLGTEFLRLLIDFTGETKESFMTPEIVDRLAAMLDYNLDLLAGPRCQELKVKDPKKVAFEPRNLLRQILSVYLNLAVRPEFVAAIARDGRSYKRETFQKAASIAQKYMLKSPPEVEAFVGMIDQVETVRQMEADEEEDLGEVPDEYLDPLMATLMKDPVVLPSSKAVVDRSTIKAHLLSDATDPFNRMPLKIEDVVPADELRGQIEAFMQERRNKRQEASSAAVQS